MPSSAFVGVDIGTSSSKGVLVSADGRLLRTAVRSHVVERPQPGHVEMDPEIWWRELTEIAAELTGDLGSPGAPDVVVRALGVSGMGPCLVLADEDGTPVRPAVLYGVDTRATDQIAELEDRLGRDAIFAACGSMLSSQAVGPKVLWVRQREPERYARARLLLTTASYLVHRLTGVYVLDHHSASQCTPMYDTVALRWHPEWAAMVAPGLRLPELRWSGDAAGATSAPLAGIPAGTPVVTGTIDAWAEAVSADAQNTGDLMLMYGTTMFLVATAPQRLTSPTLWGTVGVFDGTRNLAGGMATSGAITSWLSELTGADYPQLLAEAEVAGPGAHGLLMLPYFAGERTPVFDPDARGVVVGLTVTHTRGDLYRAALEATAFGVRHNVEAMRTAGADIRRVVAVGGGTQGDLWTQIVSDVTGLDQVVPTRTIGASYGSAMLAAGLVQDVDAASWNPPAAVRRPDPRATASYDELYALYLALYPATRRVAHALAARQRPQHASSTSPSKDTP